MSDPRLTGTGRLMPWARPSWRGRTNVDALTIACIEHAEQLAGHRFTVTQGSYQAGGGDPNSAGTHDAGGVVDLRWTGRRGDVHALRAAGMAAWHRTPAQGPWPDHIHAVVIGHPLLAPAAARQVADYLAGRDGLADNRPDPGPRLTPIPRPVWPWPPQEDDMTPEQLDQLADKIETRIRRMPIHNDDGAPIGTLEGVVARINKRMIEVLDDIDAHDRSTK